MNPCSAIPWHRAVHRLAQKLFALFLFVLLCPCWSPILPWWCRPCCFQLQSKPSLQAWKDAQAGNVQIGVLFRDANCSDALNFLNFPGVLLTWTFLFLVLVLKFLVLGSLCFVLLVFFKPSVPELLLQETRVLYHCSSVRCAHSLHCWMRPLLVLQPWVFTHSSALLDIGGSDLLGRSFSTHMKKNLWWFEMAYFLDMPRTVLSYFSIFFLLLCRHAFSSLWWIHAYFYTPYIRICSCNYLPFRMHWSDLQFDCYW